MGPALHISAILGFAILAYALARLPRALFTEAAEGVSPTWKVEVMLALALFAIGVAAFESGLGGEPPTRMVLGALLMVFGAVIYGDLRSLTIPDLYSVLVALPAFIGPLSPGLLDASLGAAVCGGLLMIVAWVWKRRTSVEGLGFGDVKLAAGIGALLGPERGLWAITVSAAGGAILGLILTMARRREGPLLFPFGVPLAMAGAGFLIWRLR